MKNILFITVTMLFMSSAAFSQFGVKAGFALGEPLDDNTSNLFFGFDVGVTYEISENLRAELLIERIARKDVITLGFFGSFSIKSIIMPITVGADYRFLTDKIQPYAGLNVGLYRFTGKATGQSNSDSYFGLFPKAGVSVEITDNILIDANIKYHLAFNKNDKMDPANNEGFVNIDGSPIAEQKNTTIFGANVGLIYKFN